MTMSIETPAIEVAEARRRFPVVWIVPIVAALLAVAVAAQQYVSRGPMIEISFQRVGGLEEGKTKIKYKDVDIGIVEKLTLDPARDLVIVSARMDRGMSAYLDTTTLFWIVRPRISASGVTGLETVVSGSYIQAAWSDERGERRRVYAGLSEPPQTPPGTPGMRVTLRSPEGTSVGVGATVYYKHITVGRIEERRFAPDGRSIELQAFIEAPYHLTLSPTTRFWNASGVALELNATGAALRIQSLPALLDGGIAFDETGVAVAMGPKRPLETYNLFPTERDARESLYGEGDALRFTILFKGSIRGLEVGAPVEYRGLRVGKVLELRPYLDETTRTILISTIIELHPQRIGIIDQDAATNLQLLQMAVSDLGLRAKLRSGNLLTGALFVDLVVLPEAEPARINVNAAPYPEFPAIPTDIEEISANINALAQRFNELPLEEIVVSTAQVLDQLNTLLADPRTQATPAKLSRVLDDLHKVLVDVPGVTEALKGSAEQANVSFGQLAPGSELYYETLQAIRELRQAARAVSALADTVEEKPNSIILGK